MTKKFCDCCGVEMVGDAVFGGIGSSKEAINVSVTRFNDDKYPKETLYCINCSGPIKKILEAKR